MLPGPEPTALLRAHLVHPIHSLDMPLEENVVSECPTMGCLTLSQAKLKAAVKWPPEPQLIDNITALTHARLATCSTCNEFAPQVSRHLPDRLAVVEPQHPCNVISETNGTNNKCSPVSCKTAPQQSCFHKAEEHPLGCPEALPELVLRALKDTLPDLEPVVLLRAHIVVNPICSLDTPPEEDVESENPATGHPSTPQARFEAVIKQPPESWLIDNIAALTYPPDKSLGMDKQHPDDVVSKTIRMSAHYLPSPKAALSLPNNLPVALSQALILHPGFNGHKPLSFDEGEGQLKESAVSKKHRASVTHSLIRETACTLATEPMVFPWAPHLPLCEPLYAIWPKRHPHIISE